MNIDQYLKERNRDFDYYLFWADDIFDLAFDYIIESGSLVRCQIAAAHFLMDQGQEKFYQEDGHILGEIFWNSIKNLQGAN
jgi:hypothetical protein